MCRGGRWRGRLGNSKSTGSVNMQPRCRQCISRLLIRVLWPQIWQAGARAGRSSNVSESCAAYRKYTAWLTCAIACRFGSGISSRNSEVRALRSPMDSVVVTITEGNAVCQVVHAGLYYAKNSLKAKLCVRGKHLLYDFASTRGVPVRRCGKIVVATSADQVATLDAIKQRAMDNGVDDVELLDTGEVRRLEPEVRCLKALLSPSTGDRRHNLSAVAKTNAHLCRDLVWLCNFSREQVLWTRTRSWAP